jgi:class 3 adenylate cyclase/predicted ATPase
MPDLVNWLKQFGLEALAGVLASNDVDLDILPDLTEADFEKLGISLGHRRKLLKAIAALHGAPVKAAEATAEAPATPPKAVPTPEAERRQVTVLFSDLVGSTALATALDPEDMSDLIKRYQDACAGAIARFDGYIAKFLGDGVLAYFGYPQAHEDSTESSVRAALAIVDAVSRIARPDGRRLEARIGIATGLVVVGDIIGSGAAREESIVGETPNLAARLQTLAEPNTVIVADATYRLLGRTFDYENRDEHMLKGFAKPVPAWRVLREAPLASRFEAARATILAPFVGRVQEMGLLLERWRFSQHGEGQTVLLTGEPGMGKSRLVEALFERVGSEPHRRIVVQCSPYHANTAFYPVLRQIEQAARFALEDSTTQKLDKLDAWLAKAGMPLSPIAPLLANLLSLPAEHRYPPLELAPAQLKNAAISALVDYILHLSEREPVLLDLEDAQWIDPTTLELTTRLIDSIGSARVLVVVTARPEFVSPWTGRDHVLTVALSRLSKTQCAEIVAGIAAAHSLTLEVVDDILARTDGVPLFVEELTRTMAESLTLDRLAVPATLQNSLMARLDRLGPAKEIAQIAAAIGRQFAQALLAAVAPVDAGELEGALARLTEASLVFPQSRAIEPTYSFRHALTRDVAYDSLLRSRRQQLHERIARTLEERFPALAEAEPEILAYHFSQAGVPASASIYSERAGDRAAARSAFAEAVAHFDAALTEIARMPPGGDRDRRELAVLLKRGPAVLIYKGLKGQVAEGNYQRAYEIAKPLGDDGSLFKAIWGIWFCSNLSRRTAAARDRAEELVALAQRSGDESLILEAIHCRWSTAFFRGDVQRTLSDGREGIRHYDPDRHGRLAAEFGGHDPGVCANTVAGLALAQMGRMSEAAAAIERGLLLAKSLNHPNSLAFGCMNATTTYQIIGDRPAVLRCAAPAIEIADRFNSPPQRSIAIFMSGWARAHGEGLADGLAAMEAEFARTAGMGPLPQYYACLLGSVRLASGHTARALELLGPILDSVDEPGVGFYLPEVYRLRGECLLRLDPQRLDEAVDAFEAAITAAKQQHALEFQLRAALSLARACSAAGTSGKGIAPLREVIALFDGNDDPPELAGARQLVSSLPN